ncbi:hypothetical protein SLEP1_g5277 [Rubroshorea leprosula]|uniref:Uncharacterized protein n=1 Tax=Rubroshorea leprosula TaxID=152421 RepID=A0AAV5HZC1_9ROSI|nr:hypothetical protein SLEP1_g5277 [Rubroshorea leprosula]
MEKRKFTQRMPLLFFCYKVQIESAISFVSEERVLKQASISICIFDVHGVLIWRNEGGTFLMHTNCSTCGPLSLV